MVGSRQSNRSANSEDDWIGCRHVDVVCGTRLPFPPPILRCFPHILLYQVGLLWGWCTGTFGLFGVKQNIVPVRLISIAFLF